MIVRPYRALSKRLPWLQQSRAQSERPSSKAVEATRNNDRQLRDSELKHNTSKPKPARASSKQPTSPSIEHPTWHFGKESQAVTDTQVEHERETRLEDELEDEPRFGRLNTATRKRRDLHRVEGFEFDETDLSATINGEVYRFDDKAQLRLYQRSLVAARLQVLHYEEYRRELEEFEARDRKNKTSKERFPSPKRRVATLSEAVLNLQRTTQPRLGGRFKASGDGQPYSIPQPERFYGLKARAQRLYYKNMGLDKVSVAPEYGANYTRPLLLTFDAFGTLIEPREPVPDQYRAIFAEHGYDFGSQEIGQAFKQEYKRFNSDFPNYGRGMQDMTVETWWVRLVEQVLKRLLEGAPSSIRNQIPAALPLRVYEHFKTVRAWTTFSDVPKFLQILGVNRQTDVWPPAVTMLGIVSNTDPRVRSILESFGMQIKPRLAPSVFAPVGGLNTMSRQGSTMRIPQMPALFSFATLSYECEKSKPDPGIYDAAIRDAQKALDSLSVEQRFDRTWLRVVSSVNNDFHHMHVGDELEKDILPALRRGWDAVLLDRSAPAPLTFRESEGYRFPVIKDLSQLENLVTKNRIEAADGPGSRWKPVAMNEQPSQSTGLSRDEVQEKVLPPSQSRHKETFEEPRTEEEDFSFLSRSELNQ